MSKHPLLDAARSATAEELCARLRREDYLKNFLQNDVSDTSVNARVELKLSDKRLAKLSVSKAEDLEDSLSEEIFKLFEENMKELYLNSTNGYQPDDKRHELFHKESRFIIIQEEASSKILAFTSFRFDTEDTAEDDAQIEVVYCYEVQVSREARGAGLGKLLMRCLETLARAYSLSKVMLTVFESNVEARTFYKRIDFENDEICPSNYEYEDDEEKPDYLILSRNIRARSSRSKKKKRKSVKS